MKSGEESTVGGFEIGACLGAGGMGAVYGATHRATGMPAAIKLISTQSGEAAVRRFRREVRSHAALRHPGIVYLFDHGELGALVGHELPPVLAEYAPQTPFLAMELAPHGTLRHNSVRSWNRVRDIVVQVLESLAYAHARGVVHRDLKPENLLVFGEEDEPRVKLTDFGIAHALESPRHRDLGSLHLFSGTPYYMPPEQAQGRWREYGPWTDLYSVACIVYELVSSRPPFVADSPLRVVLQHGSAPRPALSPQFEVPAALDAWVRRAMAVDRRERFQRASEALAALPGAFHIDAASAGVTAEREVAETVDLQPPPTVAMEPANEPTAADVTVRGLTDTAPSRPTFQDDQTTPARSRTTPHDDERLVGAGLGLFGLRQPPLVGRDDECRSLWEAFVRTTRTRHLEIVLLEGDAGVGKSRLAEWVTTRAHEIGGAHVLRAFHGREMDAGFARLVREAFSTWHLSRGEVYDHLREALPPLDETDALREVDARALTEYLHPTDRDDVAVEGPRFVFSTVEQKLALSERLIRRFAGQRPTVVWLDDVQWSSEGLSLLEYLPTRAPLGPVLVVATLRTDIVAARPSLAARVRAIHDGEGITRRPIGPLDSESSRELVAHLLPLAPATVELLAERMEGNPLFGVQVLAQWIDRGAIEPNVEGLRVDAETTGGLPDGIHALWIERIAHLLEEFEDPEAAGTVLELAATLGRDIRADEWRALCESHEFARGSRLVDALSERGLGYATAEGWRFAHGLLIESLERMASDAGRSQGHHARCAMMLEARDRASRLLNAERRARHWIAADEPHRALEPLLEASERARTVGDQVARRDFLLQRKSLLERLGVPGHDIRHLENDIEVARSESRLSEDTGALDPQRYRRLCQRADDSGNDLMRTRAWRLAAQHHHWTCDFAESRRCAETAREAARRSGDPVEIVASLNRLGNAEFHRGEANESEQWFARARALAAKADRHFDEIYATQAMAATSIMRGDDERAHRLLREALAEAHDRGYREIERTCLNGLGELARFGGRAEEARALYLRYRAAAEEVNRASEVVIAESNLAQVALMERDFDRARAHLQNTARLAEDLSIEYFETGLLCCRAVVAAGTGDTARFDELFAQLTPWGDERPLWKDHPWVLEFAAKDLAAAGDSERALLIWTLTASLWQRLGDLDAVERVKQEIEPRTATTRTS